jgi:hypothetical protein
MENAIKDTMECYKVCEETMKYCHEIGGKHVEPMHMQAIIDCKEACQMATSFMIRESVMHGDVCQLCADACNSCAEYCEKFESDKVMQKCVEVCRRCEESCREMASM